MDYIAKFEKDLKEAKNAQCIARIIDAAFNPKRDDSFVLDADADFDLSFSYKDCIVGSSTIAEDMEHRSSTIAENMEHRVSCAGYAAALLQKK